MAKNAYINVRVEEEVKTKAEEILNELGINTSTAIDLFLNQIILKDGLPFDVRLPKIDYDKCTKELLEEGHLSKDVVTEQWFDRIVSMYAKGYITKDVAVYAVKKGYKMD